MNLDSDQIDLPAFLASALINGDTSGIDDSPEDLALLEQVLTFLGQAQVVGCEDQTFFGTFSVGGQLFRGELLTYHTLS